MSQFTQAPRAVVRDAFNPNYVWALMLLLLWAAPLSVAPPAMNKHEWPAQKQEATKVVNLSAAEVEMVSGGASSSTPLLSLIMSSMTPIGNGAFTLDIASVLAGLNSLPPPMV
ncbi:MAG TPA: hypothetical protein VFK88_00955 [Gallionella sp.]|nr:hypothetical protein [Gallionella sp.]